MPAALRTEAFISFLFALLDLILDAVVAEDVLAAFHLVGHADLSGPTHPTQVIRIDVIVIQTHLQGELGGLLEEILDVAQVDERERLRQRVPQRIPHKEPVYVVQVDVALQVRVHTLQFHLQDPLSHIPELSPDEKKNQIEEGEDLEKTFEDKEEPGSKVLGLLEGSPPRQVLVQPVLSLQLVLHFIYQVWHHTAQQEP